jgi:hypothetical protein
VEAAWMKLSVIALARIQPDRRLRLLRSELRHAFREANKERQVERDRGADDLFSGRGPRGALK